MRLHLIGLLDLQSSPTVLPLSLSRHVETDSSPTKHTVFTLRTSRWVTHHNTLGWRCRALPPGPQRLHYEGITTILLLYDTAIYVSTKSDPPPILTKLETFKNYELIVTLCGL
jgi:hypothetical protein